MKKRKVEWYSPEAAFPDSRHIADDNGKDLPTLSKVRQLSEDFILMIGVEDGEVVSEKEDGELSSSEDEL